MRALLLAAGLGTRLDPLTRYLPKCLMPLYGRPLLDIWLERLSRLGVDEFVVNTHHHADLVAEYVRRSRFANQVRLAHEPDLLGTSGTIREHAGFLAAGESLVLHADNLCGDDLTGLIKAHRSRPAECIMTMLTFRTSEPSSCGIAETDKRGVLVALHHKVANPPGNVANAATYVFAPELVREVVAAPEAWDFSSDTLPVLVGRAMTHHTEMPFVDIGTVPAYLRAATDSDVWVGEGFSPQASENLSENTDVVAMQELVWKVRPDLIVETGVARGGSLLLSASLLALLDLADATADRTILDPSAPRRSVVGIDIDIRPHNRTAIESHPFSNRITLIEGSSIDPGVVATVTEVARQHQRVMVLLDSSHTHAHVLAELEAYAPLVHEGGYCVVFDTVIEEMPVNTFPDRPWSPGDSPLTAVKEFLGRNDGWAVDVGIDNRLLISVARRGYLRRT